MKIRIVTETETLEDITEEEIAESFLNYVYDPWDWESGDEAALEDPDSEFWEDYFDDNGEKPSEEQIERVVEIIREEHRKYLATRKEQQKKLFKNRKSILNCIIDAFSSSEYSELSSEEILELILKNGRKSQ